MGRLCVVEDGVESGVPRSTSDLNKRYKLQLDSAKKLVRIFSIEEFAQLDWKAKPVGKPGMVIFFSEPQEKELIRDMKSAIRNLQFSCNDVVVVSTNSALVCQLCLDVKGRDICRRTTRRVVHPETKNCTLLKTFEQLELQSDRDVCPVLDKYLQDQPTTELPFEYQRVRSIINAATKFFHREGFGLAEELFHSLPRSEALAFLEREVNSNELTVFHISSFERCLGDDRPGKKRRLAVI